MKKLPAGWDFVQLNKIADIIRGVSYDGSDSEKKDGEGYASILRAGNIGSSITYDDLVYVPERYVSQEQYLKAGDILIATSSGSKHIVGKAAQIKNDKKISFGAFCCVIRPKKVDPEYLNFYLQSKHYKSFVQRTLRGANINNLRISQIRELEIPFPPLPAQKKIAAVLEKAEKLREWRKEADGLTDKFLKSTFLEMFGDPVSNPKGWEQGKLGDFFSDVRYGVSTKSSSKGYPIIGMNSISYDGRIDWNNLSKVDLPPNIFQKEKLEKNDLLFNRTNASNLVGKTGIVDKEIEAVSASYLIRLRIKPSFQPYFVWYLMNSPFFKAIFTQKCKKAVNQANINSKELAAFPAIFPPLPLQQKFASIIQQVEQIRQYQEQSKHQIDNFFNVLMQKAFNGELEA
jgi:type I restriction enzyme S subunit